MHGPSFAGLVDPLLGETIGTMHGGTMCVQLPRNPLNGKVEIKTTAVDAN